MSWVNDRSVQFWCAVALCGHCLRCEARSAEPTPSDPPQSSAATSAPASMPADATEPPGSSPVADDAVATLDAGGIGTSSATDSREPPEAGPTEPEGPVASERGEPEVSPPEASDSSAPEASMPTGSTAAPETSQSPTATASPAASDASVPSVAPRLSDYQPLGNPISLNGLDAASSDVTWRPESDTFFVITDGSRTLYEFDHQFTTLVRTIALQDGPTDGEGIAYLGADRFAIASEDNTVVVFALDPLVTTLNVSDALLADFEPAPPPPKVNTGFEGITFRPSEGGALELLVCQEGDPGSVPIAVYGFLFTPDGPLHGSVADGSLEVAQPFDAQATLGQLQLDLTGMAYEPRDATLLITSHIGSRLLKVDPDTGELIEELPLSASPQYEGVALASDNRLVLLSEPGFVELWQAQ